MLDFNHLVNSNQNVQIFQAADTVVTSGTTSSSWQTWIKPRGANLIHIFAVGGGGGGANGQIGALGTSRGGCGGGGAPGQSVLIPALLLPDILYIMVGRGGLGGIPGTPATSGGQTIVSISSVPNPTTLVTNTFGHVINTYGAGGATATAAGAAGLNNLSGSERPARVLGFAPNHGAGQIGSLSAAGADGGSLNVFAGNLSTPFNGGTAGGSTRLSVDPGFNGGSFINSTTHTLGETTHWPYQPGGIGGSGGLPGINGCNGFKAQDIMHFYPATGGGAGGVTGNGGNGGNGAPGCGGGGGGACFTGFTAGVGGSGGSGFVIILSA